MGSTLNAEYHEIIFGAAWRPVTDDRFDALRESAIFDDEPSTTHISFLGNTIKYTQQSHSHQHCATKYLSKDKLHYGSG